MRAKNNAVFDGYNGLDFLLLINYVFLSGGGLPCLKAIPDTGQPGRSDEIRR